MLVRRLLEPIILGVSANVLINFAFNPKNPDLIFSEFAIACFLAFPITELSRIIDNHLEPKVSWGEKPFKRFGYHFFLLAIALIILLNGLGNMYLWLSGKGFFSLNEVVAINLITLFVAMIITAINWTIHFYNSWRQSASALTESNNKLSNLEQRMSKASMPIEVSQGKSKVFIEAKNIRIAESKHGITRMFLENGESGIFNSTLKELHNLLPEELFFPINRNTILHRDVIISISPSSHGKIQLTIKDNVVNQLQYTVSRPKASSFRRWYNSNPTLKT